MSATVLKLALVTPITIYNSVCNLFVILVVSNFGFEVGAMVLIVPVPGHCLPFTVYRNNHTKVPHLNRQ